MTLAAEVFDASVNVALVAAACGGDDDDGGAAPAPPAPTEAPAPDPTPPADEPPPPPPAEEMDDEPMDDAEEMDDEPMDDAEEMDDELSVADNPDNGVTSDSIKVGWMGDLTGPTASSQAFNSHGIEAYFTCANERGGVLGRMFDYLPSDDEFSAEKAAVNFTKLTEDDKVLALLGLGGSHIST